MKSMKELRAEAQAFARAKARRQAAEENGRRAK